MIFINSRKSPQRGSVLFIILIAVALFAALSYAVSNMMRGGADIGREKSGVLVSEILTYAQSMREAVHMMRISNDCSDDEISFERSPFDGSDTNYINPKSPSDHSCYIFHPDGGGIANVTPSEEVSQYDYFYTGVFGVTGIGSDSNGELSLILRGLNLMQCEIINERLGLSAPQPDPIANTNFITVEFVGNYAVDGGVGTGFGTGDAIYNNKSVGCFFENNATSGEYFFYQVLLPR